MEKLSFHRQLILKGNYLFSFFIYLSHCPLFLAIPGHVGLHRSSSWTEWGLHRQLRHLGGHGQCGVLCQRRQRRQQHPCQCRRLLRKNRRASGRSRRQPAPGWSWGWATGSEPLCQRSTVRGLEGPNHWRRIWDSVLDWRRSKPDRNFFHKTYSSFSYLTAKGFLGIKSFYHSALFIYSPLLVFPV